jgi:hypothetical protein
MATSPDPNLYYFRRYMDDPYVPVESSTPQTGPVIEVVDANLCYYRRYLDDPATCK